LVPGADGSRVACWHAGEPLPDPVFPAADERSGADELVEAP